MRIPRIYTSQTLQAGIQLDLEAGPSHHLIKVLRMNEGRELIVFNGDGHEYSAVIKACSKKTASVEIRQATFVSRQSPIEIELAIGLSKGDRFEWVLQKATELGITKISPLITERTEVKLNEERLNKKMQSWQSIIIAACEQCQRNILPELNMPVALSTYLAESGESGDYKFVLHHRADKGLSELAKPQSATLMVGPEGGLSEQEIDQALSHSFTPLALGPRVMRTETAPVAALSILQFLWGDLH